jgi:tripartite-type tricarboxylate transporter receptor subunit TctC
VNRTARTLISAATAIVVVLMLGASMPSRAADKPVRIVVPYSPGGTTDYAARQLALKLSEQTGTSYFVDNRAGATGVIGSGFVANSTPDGTTLLLNDVTYAFLPHLMKKLPWDKDALVPVTDVLEAPLVVVVGASSPYKTMNDLVMAARKNPDKLTFGSGGVGSFPHLSGELLKQAGKLSLTHIPYKGAGEAMVGLISGQVDVLVTAAPTAIPQVHGGRVRALMVTSAQRLPALPEVPTSAEAGMKDFNASNWFALAVPKGTPAAVIERLRADVAKAVSSPDIVSRFAEQGAVGGGMAVANFQHYVQEQSALWDGVIDAAGLQPE